MRPLTPAQPWPVPVVGGTTSIPLGSAVSAVLVATQMRHMVELLWAVRAVPAAGVVGLFQRR